MAQKKLSLDEALAEVLGTTKKPEALSLEDALREVIGESTEKEPPRRVMSPFGEMTPHAINEAGERIDAQGNVIQPGVADKTVALLRGENPVVNLAVDLLPVLSGLGALRTGAGVAKKAPATLAETPAVVKAGAAYMTLKGLGVDDSTAIAGAAAAATFPFKRASAVAPATKAATASEMVTLRSPSGQPLGQMPRAVYERFRKAGDPTVPRQRLPHPSAGAPGGAPVAPYVPTPVPSHTPAPFQPKYRSGGPLPPPDVTPPSGPFEAPGPSYGLGPPLPTPAPRSAPIVAPSAPPAAKKATLESLVTGAVKSEKFKVKGIIQQLQSLGMPDEMIAERLSEVRTMTRLERQSFYREMAQELAKQRKAQ